MLSTRLQNSQNSNPSDLAKHMISFPELGMPHGAIELLGNWFETGHMSDLTDDQNMKTNYKKTYPVGQQTPKRETCKLELRGPSNCEL